MKDQYKIFYFEDCQFDLSTKVLTMKYSFDSKLFFEEKITFDFDFVKDFSEEALDRAFFALWIMAGISYFKAALPPKIVFKKGNLTDSQKAFFNKIYTHGLGEFFCVNKIDPKGKINFEGTKKEGDYHVTFRFICNNNALVPLGGGKDSLTTIEILKSQDIDFETITVDSDERFEAVSKIIEKNHLNISRKISPELIKLNKEGALNGHVPISAIWAFIFICTAILRGNKNIILSNEHSANEATTQYKGMVVNHQYSKTLEFEKDLQNYINKNITPQINYFSFLRPLTELHIAQIFCSEISDKYKDNFSSCNKNFRIKEREKKMFTWCNNCPKCAFVFTIFSPFLSKEKLIKIFGENLYIKSELESTFIELLGLTDSKPFECVGEVMEVIKAMIMAKDKFPEVVKFLDRLSEEQRKEATNVDYQELHPSSMSKYFNDILEKFIG